MGSTIRDNSGSSVRLPHQGDRIRARRDAHRRTRVVRRPPDGFGDILGLGHQCRLRPLAKHALSQIGIRVRNAALHAGLCVFAEVGPRCAPRQIRVRNAALHAGLCVFAEVGPRCAPRQHQVDARVLRATGVIPERVDRLLLHLFQHQIHHRGQVHGMLSGTRISPPQLDEFYLDGDLPLRAADKPLPG
ncbi:MAG: damage-inducible protein DinB [Pseudomonas sp.]|nr:MAG: damage-inducible protein DinB [Pseudomonas sp.]